MTTSPPSTKRFVVGITGASGARYAQRLISTLVALGCETHIVVTSFGKRLLRDELGMEVVSPSTLHTLTGLPDDADHRANRVILHPTSDVGAQIASGSFRHDGMVIIPCSSNTLGAVASGAGDTLVTRAAAVALKERFPLILAHRESPLSLIDIENMRTLTLAGAVIAPCNPGLYLNPTTIDDLIDFVVARVLDLLKVEHEVCARWGEPPQVGQRTDS